MGFWVVGVRGRPLLPPLLMEETKWLFVIDILHAQWGGYPLFDHRGCLPEFLDLFAVVPP